MPKVCQFDYDQGINFTGRAFAVRRLDRFRETLPMSETWLKTNRRALSLGLVVPGLILLAAGGGLAWSVVTGQHGAIQLLLAVLTVGPLWMIGELLYALSRPRIGYEPGELLVYFDAARPTRVPIEIVEVFFLGQGPSELPPLKGREPETQNVIVRLAESAADWKHRDVRPAIGHWCEGYITIRGSWCEPITPTLMRELNHRLAEIHRAQRAAEKAEVKDEHRQQQQPEQERQL
jgi:hypothetical protein